MKLLIITQAVDSEDTILGFFIRWIEEFSKKCESVEVICLKEGTHALLTNVRVYSLGKEKSVSRVKYIFNFYRYLWCLRHDYDAIFVHMNEEYVLMGGPFWKLTKKKIVLWRTHRVGSWRTRLAVALSDVVCCTSPHAFVAEYAKAVRMPMGIDTEIFIPPATVPLRNTILFLGRLDPVKKPDVFLKALATLSEKGTNFKADLYGSPTNPQAPYAREYTTLAAPLVAQDILTLHASVRHSETPQLYQTHAIYVNLTPSGSFDKTIGEAMASGCSVVLANEAVRGAVPEEFMAGDSAESVADALEKACAMSGSEREKLGKKMREYIVCEHSLALLVGRLLATLEPIP